MAWPSDIRIKILSNFSTVKLMGSIVPEKETSERNDLGMTGGSIFFCCCIRNKPVLPMEGKGHCAMGCAFCEMRLWPLMTLVLFIMTEVLTISRWLCSSPSHCSLLLLQPSSSSPQLAVEFFTSCPKLLWGVMAVKQPPCCRPDVAALQCAWNVPPVKY